MHVIAAKAVVFQEAQQPSFTIYQQRVLDNALVLARELQAAGLRIVSGGTDNHIVLVDLSETGVTGKDAQEALEAVGIVVNRNAVPFDLRPPRITSGMRLGTAAVASRGFGAEEIKIVAASIVNIIRHPTDKTVQQQISQEVKQLCRRFPVPGISD
jgi:glycine hydroxymethyltransferase